MMRSLYSGVAGLKTHQTKMDVIGNNISNVNTVAFKSSSTQFQDIMYQTTSGASGPTATTGGKNAKQIGLGVTTGATKISIASSGAAQSTGEAFDIRLVDSNSTNFFIVNNGTQNLFTRAGSFYLDGNGNLAMTSTGYLVMGWQAEEIDGTRSIKTDTVSPLRLMQPENLTSAPEKTSQGTFSGIIDKNDVNVTSEDGYMRNFTFYDGQGFSYTAKFAIKKTTDEAGNFTDDDSYTVELVSILDPSTPPKDILDAYLKSANADGTPHSVNDLFGGIEASFEAASGYEGITNVFTVDASGTLMISTANQGAQPVDQVFKGFVQTADMVTGNATDGYQFVAGSVEYDPETNSVKSVQDITNGRYNLKFNKADGSFSYIGTAGLKSVTFNFDLLGDENDNKFGPIEIDFSQMKTLDNGGNSTVEAEKGAVDGTTGAGKKKGELTSIAVSGDGRIFGSYSNGNTVLLGQIAVARFANASGLESLGNNCYGTTLNSGEFDGMGVDVTADGGSMNSGQLEMSNVDLSTEFTEMITTQRGFQANSRIITVSDTLLEELTNLKR